METMEFLIIYLEFDIRSFIVYNEVLLLPKILECLLLLEFAVGGGNEGTEFVPTKCRLALVDEFSGNSVIVADGAAEPCPSGVIHNKKMNRDIYKVSVDHVYSDYSHLNLLEETDDSITKLGEAKGYFLGWPADLVFFTDEVIV